MRNRNSIRMEIVLMIISLVIFGFFLLFVTFYYNRIVDSGAADGKAGQTYRWQYEMIVDSRNSTFWQAVYSHAREEAAAENALLSLHQTGWNTEYDKLDYLDMYIAADVDGIILEYNGEEGLIEKIDEAAEHGIPVVTIINDPNRSRRQSFVGVNDYQLGSAYASQVAELIDEDTENILVISNREKELEKNQMYAQIYAAVSTAHHSSGEIGLKEQNLISWGQFDVEEAVRNIFQAAEGTPDILVCLDEVTTECAYQAMIDFNMVGEVKIIGFYTTDTILDGVRRGLIPVTIEMDADQIGTYSIEALTEYLTTGRSNTYYTVDLHAITAEDLKQRDIAEEQSLPEETAEVQDE